MMVPRRPCMRSRPPQPWCCGQPAIAAARGTEGKATSPGQEGRAGRSGMSGRLAGEACRAGED